MAKKSVTRWENIGKNVSYYIRPKKNLVTFSSKIPCFHFSVTQLWSILRISVEFRVLKLASSPPATTMIFSWVTESIRRLDEWLYLPLFSRGPSLNISVIWLKNHVLSCVTYSSVSPPIIMLCVELMLTY